MMNHWIQTAIELRHSTVGNLYSFSTIMHSLLSAPVGFGQLLCLLYVRYKSYKPIVHTVPTRREKLEKVNEIDWSEKVSENP